MNEGMQELLAVKGRKEGIVKVERKVWWDSGIKIIRDAGKEEMTKEIMLLEKKGEEGDGKEK